MKFQGPVLIAALGAGLAYLYPDLLNGLFAAPQLATPDSALSPGTQDVPNYIKLPPKPGFETSLTESTTPPAQSHQNKPASTTKPKRPTWEQLQAWIQQQIQAGKVFRDAAKALGVGAINQHASSGFGSDSFKTLQLLDANIPVVSVDYFGQSTERGFGQSGGGLGGSVGTSGGENEFFF